MNEVLLIAGMVLVTFIPRYLPILLAGKINIPPLLEEALNFVPIAVLTVIIAQTTLFRDGQLALSVHNAHLIAMLCAFVAALVWKRLFLTVLIGLLGYAMASWLL
ncbi:MAG: AzlD domain-containing protein [Arenicella sp.]